MAILPYTTGTVTLANGSTTVTGSGTNWLSSGLEADDDFRALGLNVRIASINSNTQLTLAKPWPGTSLAAGSNYEAFYKTDSERVLSAALQVLSSLTSGIVSAFAGLTWAADKIAYGTGAGTMALLDFKAWARSFIGAADVSAARTALGVPSNSEAVLLTGSQTITGIKTITRGIATQQIEYLQLRPSDYGTGKPYMALQKLSTSATWGISLWDGVSANGSIYINSSAVQMPGTYATTTANAANANIGSDGTLARSTSSEKYKTDVEPMQDAYADLILQMQPIWYRSTCEIDNPQWSYWGLSAEAVAAIDPRLVHWKTHDMVTELVEREVTEEIEGETVTRTETVPVTTAVPREAPEAEGVAYERLTVHLINLAQRQHAAIEALTARMEALEGANS